MTSVWVQKDADGSVCTLWHHSTPTMPSHEPCEVREASVMSSGARPSMI